MENLKSLRKQIPRLSGVYLYKDNENNVIYVGKAVNLYNRVNSYFSGKKDPKTTVLVKKIHAIEYFVTQNETEALILENNLIKQLHPKYNISLKDSKTYPYIKITGDSLPRIYKTRENHLKYAEYFGPYVNTESADAIISMLNKILKLRVCKKTFKPPYTYQPCLNYHIGLCSSPCSGKISRDDYTAQISLAREFLKGNRTKLIKELKEKMNSHSDALEFELAQKIRDTLRIIENFNEIQSVETDDVYNADYIGFYTDNEILTVSLIAVRSGKMVDRRNYLFTVNHFAQDMTSDFLSSYYIDTLFPPEKVYMSSLPKDKLLIENSIMQKNSLKIQFQNPHLTRDKRLTKLAEDNASIYFEEKRLKLDKIHYLRDLKIILNLPVIPRHIECLDIATLNGSYNTAAISVFIDGVPDTSLYRQYNIQGEGHPDDYTMMKEIIVRRYQKMYVQHKKLPDLLILDGGKGQLNAVAEIIDILKIPLNIVSIAKKNEEIFTRYSRSPIVLPASSYSLKIIQAVRDESHRFSNTRLSSRYSRNTLTSDLTKIKGIGLRRAIKLQKSGLSYSKLKNMSKEEILKLEGIGADLAEKIYTHFHV